MNAASVRAQARATMIDEIKAAARKHLGTDGANLALRAVARDMGMVPSALYRYFPSRDDLLTALIVDGYNALGAAVEQADAAVPRADLRERWLRTCGAVRAWALRHPAEYALLFGSPVPGYVAPPDTIAAAGRTPLVLIGLLRDGAAAGVLAARPEHALPPAVAPDLVALCRDNFPGLPPELLGRGMAGWVHLFGMVSFELFGQFNNVITARDEFFAYQVGQLADHMGLPRS
jgi:AcrR family transcriptional regulator